MIYLDTSALVPLVLREEASDTMRSWLAGKTAADLTLSDWTIAEFASELGIRFRTRTLARSQVEAAWAQFRREVVASCAVLTPARRDFEQAADLVLRFDLGLRAGDALHVAIAQNAGADCLVTLDQTMARAAVQLGLRSEIPA